MSNDFWIGKKTHQLLELPNIGKSASMRWCDVFERKQIDLCCYFIVFYRILRFFLKSLKGTAKFSAGISWDQLLLNKLRYWMSERKRRIADREVDGFELHWGLFHGQLSRLTFVLYDLFPSFIKLLSKICSNHTQQKL